MILLIQLSAMKSKGTPASILFKGLTDPSSILEVPEKVKVRRMIPEPPEFCVSAAQQELIESPAIPKMGVNIRGTASSRALSPYS